MATLEDLQGTIEVVVFPKMYEQTAATWAEGAILLVAGRVDHRGEEVSLLADLDGVGRRRRARRGGVRARGRGRGPGAGPRGGAARAGTAGVERERAEPGGADGSAGSPTGRIGPGPAPVAVGPGRSEPSARGRTRSARGCRAFRRSRRRATRARAAAVLSPAAVAGLPAIVAGRPDPDLCRAREPSAAIAAGSPDADVEPAAPRRGPGSGGAMRRRRRRRSSRAGPTRCSTSASAGRRRDRLCSRWRRSSPSFGSDRAGRASSSTSPRRRRRGRCRWSCPGRSPTTPSCWRRSAVGSATASSISGSPDTRSALWPPRSRPIVLRR